MNLIENNLNIEYFMNKQESKFINNKLDKIN